MKKVWSLIITVAIILSTISSALAAAPVVQNCSLSSLDEIIKEYNDSIDQLNGDTSITNEKRCQKTQELRFLRNERLSNAGFGCCEVNSQNYESISSILNTDLRTAGLKPESNYLVIFEETAREAKSDDRGSPQPVTFNYNYNGNTYSMRTLYVYSDHAYAVYNEFLQSDTIRITGSSNLNNILDAIVAILGNCPVIGDIIGYYDTFKYFTNMMGYSGNYTGSSVGFHPAVEWQRQYTQVWSSYDSMWVFGSCVERVIAKSHYAGYIIDEDDHWVKINENEVTSYINSHYYNNTTWQKNTAVQNYLGGYPCAFDVTGNILFEHNNSTVYTAYEPSLYP